MLVRTTLSHHWKGSSLVARQVKTHTATQEGVSPCDRGCVQMTVCQHQAVLLARLPYAVCQAPFSWPGAWLSKMDFVHFLVWLNKLHVAADELYLVARRAVMDNSQVGAAVWVRSPALDWGMAGRHNDICVGPSSLQAAFLQGAQCAKWGREGLLLTLFVLDTGCLLRWINKQTNKQSPCLCAVWMVFNILQGLFLLFLVHLSSMALACLQV